MTEEQEAELDEQADDVEAEADEDAAEAEGLQDGDFVELEYTAYTADGDQLVDTTDPEVAEEEGVADQNLSLIHISERA
ncbi:FKBP-type peptidylprolyl isomerase, partial [Natrialba chahannaoensis JCM 10990]